MLVDRLTSYGGTRRLAPRSHPLAQVMRMKSRMHVRILTPLKLKNHSYFVCLLLVWLSILW